MADATTAPCTLVDPEERARILSRVYGLLIQLAQEKSADPEARTQTGTAADTPALKPEMQETL